MTQTLTRVARRLHRPAEGSSRYIILERPESDRILSGYNKKVLASAFDIKKRTLLKATGLRYGMTFPDFIHTLCKRRAESNFIDRHFVPQEILHRAVSRAEPWEKLDITTNGKSFAAGFPSVKSSAQLHYTEGMKQNLSDDDIILIKKYQSIWR